MPQLLTTLCALAGLATSHAAPQPFEGRWMVKFNNGVVEWCSVENDGSASVIEKLRDAGAKTEMVDGALVVTYTDNRVERWSMVGQRAVVEHWFPASNYPSSKPVFGIADRTDLRIKDVARASDGDGDAKALNTVRKFIESLRDGTDARSTIDPRYLTRFGWNRAEPPVERVAATTIYDLTAVDPQTVLAVVGTDQSDKEVWILRMTELQGTMYILPPNPQNQSFTAWTVRRRL